LLLLWIVIESFAGVAVIRDPFYNQILAALSSPLDEDCFELCASCVLRKELPTLVPIRGGSDSGMDGVTYADGPLLLCTTGLSVRHAGLGDPIELIREIVNQAEGRPGLAVTLSWLSLNGDVEDVFYGDGCSKIAVAFANQSEERDIRDRKEIQ
jgi:hypothetical protein